MPSYRVSGDVDYNGHAPGTVFESEENEAIERAVARGSIAQFTEAAPVPANHDVTANSERLQTRDLIKRLNVESHKTR